MLALETTDLTHRFGTDKVLDNVNLSVEPATIYGFLGPNGAGKTTTLKLALGLLRVQQGSVRIFGMPLEKSRLQILRRIGSLIESPSLYAHLTARENLRAWQRIYDCPEHRIPQVLSLVGLADTGSKKASQFVYVFPYSYPTLHLLNRFPGISLTAWSGGWSILLRAAAYVLYVLKADKG
jgi:ABC-2 type transport system ATP-binding protein